MIPQDELRDCLDWFTRGLTLPSNTHAISLVAKDEMDLAQLEQQLIELSVPHAAIREPDEPYNGQLMSIGIVPCDRNLVKKILQKFPLSK